MSIPRPATSVATMMSLTPPLRLLRANSLCSCPLPPWRVVALCCERKFHTLTRVYGQFSIETIHERRKRTESLVGRSAMALRSVLLIQIGKQNVEIKYI